MELISLEIGFENLESVKIPAEDVAGFYLGNITQTLSNDYYSEKLYEDEKTDDVQVVLRPAADRQIKEPLNAKTVFERVLKYKDITDFVLKTAEGKRKICVHWAEPDDEGCENIKQKSMVSENGHLIIVIGNQDINEIAKFYKS